VTLGGKPAEGVNVSFQPTGATVGGGGYDKTDASGKFTITYRNGEPGLPEGEYDVLFSKMVLSDGSPIPEGKDAADVDARESIPARYQDASQGLNKVRVPNQGTFNFDLPTK
jgi:hypothetical protein